MTKYKLRPHQIEAIQAFENNGSVGVLEMATGTGKTIIALEAVSRNFKKYGRQFLIIIVPFLHLIDQWIEKFADFGIDNYLKIAEGRKNWSQILKQRVWDYKFGFRDRVVLIGSYKSMGSVEFHEIVSGVKDHRFLVSDECHNLGSLTHKSMNFDEYENRLGLSATPRRWYDEYGTKRIYAIFEKTVFDYDLGQAIKAGILTPYDYHPYLVSLNDDEISHYEDLSRRIGRLMGKENLKKSDLEILEKLARDRANIIKCADGKLPMLLQLLKMQKDKKFTLVYCAPGQIDTVVEAIHSLGINVHRFNSELNRRERQEILEHFRVGEIEVLVAIRCLDEGVDVPATRVAYFMASSSNPKEFVQRRGRVLRKSEGKEKSILIDFITLQSDFNPNTFENVAKKELPRYAEFVDLASNKYNSEVRRQLLGMLSVFNLEKLLYLKPWEVYEMMLKEESFSDEFAG